MATNLFTESLSTFKGSYGYGQYEPVEIQEYPCSQNWDYDRLKFEAESLDPLNPKVDTLNPGNNAVTDFLQNVRARLVAYPPSETHTCNCKCCPQTPIYDVDFDGCCDCENDPECKRYIRIISPTEEECDAETLCNALHAYSEKVMGHFGDFISNLEDSTIENTNSGSLKNAIIRQIDLYLVKKCIRLKGGKYIFNFLNTDNPPQSDGIPFGTFNRQS
jgi:hypothetical protein